MSSNTQDPTVQSVTSSLLEPNRPAAAPTPEDGDILSLLERREHRQALALCASRHGDSLGRLCMALLGSPSEVEDAVQETLLAAHGAFSTYRGEGTLRAWLFGIARRRCARVLERRGPKLDAGAPATPEPAGEELLELRRRAQVARRLLAAARPTEREALLLRYVGELSFREVGLACGVDEATARKRVSRALARLRELVKE